MRRTLLRAANLPVAFLLAIPAVAQEAPPATAPPATAAPSAPADAPQGQPSSSGVYIPPIEPAKAEPAPQPTPSPVAPPTAPETCVPTCREGFMCHQGACISSCNPACSTGQRCLSTGQCVVEPSQDSRSYDTESEPDDADASADSPAGFSVNVLGLFQFGPELSLDFGDRVAPSIYLRPMNLGLLSYAVIAGDDHHQFNWGLSIGGALRFYTSSKGPRRGFFVGAGVEYMMINTEWTETGYRWEDDIRAVVLTPQLGYRWVWGSFSFAPGLWVGYYKTLSYERSYIDDYSWDGKEFAAGEVEQKEESGVRGGLQLELGVQF